ncbi:MAG: 2-C-methyl-D-erythritol 2,4-cyclodiphosphate synthase [Bacteroidota bacterium]|nr:2-C-methyl-D-erythritol 2,4-cyclodiphosphate synthase [Bacteroidota bacterium]
MPYRIGIGYDVHKLGKAHDLNLGGIVIPNDIGTIGHSDADVLIHAIIDAMLGAANLGDIGSHFPDSNSKYKEIDSKILLRESYKLIQRSGYSIVNIDSTLCLQTPKIKAYIPEMKKKLSSVLAIEKEQVSVKATTTEKLGFVGRQEGVSAQAVVLLEKI